MRYQFLDRSVMAVLPSQTMLPVILIVIRVIQNSVVKEQRSQKGFDSQRPRAA